MYLLDIWTMVDLNFFFFTHFFPRFCSFSILTRQQWSQTHYSNISNCLIPSLHWSVGLSWSWKAYLLRWQIPRDSLGYSLKVWGHFGLICKYVYRKSLKLATFGDEYIYLFHIGSSFASQKVIPSSWSYLLWRFRPWFPFHTTMANDLWVVSYTPWIIRSLINKVLLVGLYSEAMK